MESQDYSPLNQIWITVIYLFFLGIFLNLYELINTHQWSTNKINKKKCHKLFFYVFKHNKFDSHNKELINR